MSRTTRRLLAVAVLFAVAAQGQDLRTILKRRQQGKNQERPAETSGNGAPDCRKNYMDGAVHGANPERCREVVVVPATNTFEYLDFRMTGGQAPEDGTTPMEVLLQAFLDENFKCLTTQRVSWRGVQGSASDRQFGDKRYVIDCRGDCRGVHYSLVRMGGVVTHHALTQPYPVIHIRTSLWNYSDFSWTFTRAEAKGPPPEIRIHTWSQGLGDYGAGCKLFE